MLMRLLVVLGILVCNTAQAENLDRTKINAALKSIQPPTKIKHQNKDGLWFSNNDAEVILLLLEQKLPQALDIIDAQDIQIKALKSAVSGYKSSSASYKDVATFNQEALKTALSYFPDLEPPKLSWYEGKTAFYIYGVLSGMAVVGGSAWVLDRIQKE